MIMEKYTSALKAVTSIVIFGASFSGLNFLLIFMGFPPLLMSGFYGISANGVTICVGVFVGFISWILSENYNQFNDEMIEITWRYYFKQLFISVIFILLSTVLISFVLQNFATQLPVILFGLCWMQLAVLLLLNNRYSQEQSFDYIDMLGIVIIGCGLGYANVQFLSIFWGISANIWESVVINAVVTIFSVFCLSDNEVNLQQGFMLAYHAAFYVGLSLLYLALPVYFPILSMASFIISHNIYKILFVKDEVFKTNEIKKDEEAPLPSYKIAYDNSNTDALKGLTDSLKEAHDLGQDGVYVEFTSSSSVSNEN